MRVLLGALALLLAASPAVAQQTNPVIEHYRAYQAARDRSDLVAAEAAAERALAASEQRDGDGGSTAVLALNLAMTRLLAGDADDALAPAQRALALAQAGARGVDPALAELIVARVELATRGRAGADRLAAALASDGAAHLADEEIYAAATELGSWALRQHAFERARTAWSMAASHGAGSEFGETYGSARARTWEAASIFLDDIGRHGRARTNPSDAREAYGMLTEAMVALQPLADLDAPNLELTVAQNAYAEVMAWRLAVRVKLRADGVTVPLDPPEAQGDADGFAELGPIDLAQPRCLYQVNHTPRPRFPEEALARGQIAGVVLRLRINQAGEIVDNRVVARIGDEAFSEEVERVSSHWSVTRRDDSPANCRMAASLLVPVQFSIDYR